MRCHAVVNQGMGGVYWQDQLLACFSVMRKCVRGYRKYFLQLYTMPDVNYRNINGNTKKGTVSIRLNVAEQLLQHILLPTCQTRRSLHIQRHLFRSQATIGAIFCIFVQFDVFLQLRQMLRNLETLMCQNCFRKVQMYLLIYPRAQYYYSFVVLLIVSY